MRIAGGEWGGRLLKTPPGDKIRPTQDRVREALFSMLAAQIPGSVWIDLCAGSGAVGLEALSRGAARVTWVEKNPLNARLIAENASALGGVAAPAPPPGRGMLHAARNARRSQPLPAFPLPARAPGSELVVADATTWLGSGGCGRQADVLYADPPYELVRERGYAAWLQLAAKGNVVRENGIFIGEMPQVCRAEEVAGWALERDRLYGKTRICIWRREA